MQSSLHNPGYALRQSGESYAPSRFARAMRSGISSIPLAALVLLTLHAVAGTTEQSQLLPAQKFSNQGEIAQVIRILEPLVHSEPGALDDASRGWAWNLLGSAHQDLGEYVIARRCYEAAIHLLKTLPAAGSTYASTLAKDGLDFATIPYGRTAFLVITVNSVRRWPLAILLNEVQSQ